MPTRLSVSLSGALVVAVLGIVLPETSLYYDVRPKAVALPIVAGSGD